MLPGFRIAFATVLLTVSVLIFGLGAAALLRASYDHFVDLSSAQLTRESTVARDQRARQTTLALLRVEMAEQADAANTPAALDAAVNVVAPEPAPPVVAAIPASVTATEDPIVATRPDGRASKVLPSERPNVTTSDGIQVATIESAVREPARAEDVASRPSDLALGCLPTTFLGTGAQVALLVDPTPARADVSQQGRYVAAETTAKATRSGKSAIHRARRARLHYARLRRHRMAMRAQVIAAPPLGRAQRQPDPFLGFGR
jgi:hypothetical protein